MPSYSNWAVCSDQSGASISWTFCVKNHVSTNIRIEPFKIYNQLTQLTVPYWPWCPPLRSICPCYRKNCPTSRWTWRTSLWTYCAVAWKPTRTVLRPRTDPARPLENSNRTLAVAPNSPGRPNGTPSTTKQHLLNIIIYFRYLVTVTLVMSLSRDNDFPVILHYRNAYYNAWKLTGGL